MANLKEIRMSLRVEEHDLNIKARNARKFLEEGDKVKVSVRFRGREIAYAHKGVELLNRFAEKVSDAGSVEKEAKAEGRNAIMFLKPHTDKSKKSKKKLLRKKKLKVSIIIKQEEYDHAENENTFRSEKTISYYKIRENKKRTGRKKSYPHQKRRNVKAIYAVGLM